jgi:undecaprenyl phosphate-alpha-L-ara4N flippase subunit ArnF
MPARIGVQARTHCCFIGPTVRYDLLLMKDFLASRHTLAIGLALAIIFDTCGQLLWKFCVAGLPPAEGLRASAAAVLGQPLFIVLIGIFLCQLFNWMKVLEHADLSFAQPITSLSYLTVCVLSVVLFGEHIGLAKTAGVLCVLVGVWLVSRGKPVTRDDPETPP